MKTLLLFTLRSKPFSCFRNELEGDVSAELLVQNKSRPFKNRVRAQDLEK